MPVCSHYGRAAKADSIPERCLKFAQTAEITYRMSSTPSDRLLVAEEFVTPPLTDDVVAHASQLTRSFHHRYEAYRPRIQFYSRNRTDRCDAYRVSAGMLMLVVDVDCTHPFESRLSGQDIVEFHYRLSGSIVIGGTWGELRIREPSCLIWYQPFGCNDAAEQLGSSGPGGPNRETWVSLYCDRAWLSAHTGEYATQLLESLASDARLRAGAPHFRLQPQHGTTGRIIGELLRSRGDGALNWLYCTTKAAELLYVSLKDAHDGAALGDALRRISDTDQRLLQQARGLLESQFAAPPRLSALARRVGMNPTKLCALFKLRFGESVFDFVRRRRLEHAHDLLTRSGLQVCQVAMAVGYRHHSTFTAAFTRHFGVAPKRAQHGALTDGNGQVLDAVRARIA